MEKEKIQKVLLLHGAVILILLGCFFVSSSISKDAEFMIQNALRQGEEVRTARTNDAKSILSSKELKAMSEREFRAYARMRNETQQRIQKEADVSWEAGKKGEKQRKISEDVKWLVMICSVIYFLFLTMLMGIWIWEKRISQINLRIKLLLFVLASLTIYYTTGGRLITRSSRLMWSFWWVSAQRCEASCHFTWIDKLLFRRCISDIGGLCDQFEKPSERF